MKVFASIVLFALLTACGTGSIQSESKDANNKLSDSMLTAYQSQAKEIISASFGALSKQLMDAISKGGTSYAVAFCNLEALNITDSLSEAYHAEIKRIALKNRNPVNNPDESEELLLRLMEDRIRKGLNPGDTIVVSNNYVTYYAPILTAAACLQCHGKTDEQIQPETLQIIQEKYPDDKAVGFQLNDLRGMWRIRINK